jgi:hypothetical protein
MFYDYFPSKIAGLNNFDRDLMTHKPKTICCLSLSEKFDNSLFRKKEFFKERKRKKGIIFINTVNCTNQWGSL